MKNEGYSVNATDIEIWAKIGMYKEEALIENCFKISVVVNAEGAYQHDNPINYEIIADTVWFVFKKPQTILENICVEIIDEIKLAVKAPVDSIECEIRKENPAIEGMKVGAFGVKIMKTF